MQITFRRLTRRLIPILGTLVLTLLPVHSESRDAGLTYTITSPGTYNFSGNNGSTNGEDARDATIDLELQSGGGDVVIHANGGSGYSGGNGANLNIHYLRVGDLRRTKVTVEGGVGRYCWWRSVSYSRPNDAYCEKNWYKEECDNKEWIPTCNIGTLGKPGSVTYHYHTIENDPAGEHNLRGGIEDGNKGLDGFAAVSSVMTAYMVGLNGTSGGRGHVGEKGRSLVLTVDAPLTQELVVDATGSNGGDGGDGGKGGFGLISNGRRGKGGDGGRGGDGGTVTVRYRDPAVLDLITVKNDGGKGGVGGKGRSDGQSGENGKTGMVTYEKIEDEEVQAETVKGQ